MPTGSPAARTRRATEPSSWSYPGSARTASGVRPVASARSEGPTNTASRPSTARIASSASSPAAVSTITTHSPGARTSRPSQATRVGPKLRSPRGG
jgi:hypothetical protein